MAALNLDFVGGGSRARWWRWRSSSRCCRRAPTVAEGGRSMPLCGPTAVDVHVEEALGGLTRSVAPTGRRHAWPSRATTKLCRQPQEMREREEAEPVMATKDGACGESCSRYRVRGRQDSSKSLTIRCVASSTTMVDRSDRSWELGGRGPRQRSTWLPPRGRATTSRRERSRGAPF